MAEKTRFLIGFGERLTEPVVVRRGGNSPVPAYAPEQARERLGDDVSDVMQSVDRLPALACPRDEIVAVMTLHPTFLAKSYFPSTLLETVGLESVGSRPTEIQPDFVGHSREVDGERVNYVSPGEKLRPTTELFVATTRENLRRWGAHLRATEPLLSGEGDVVKIERLRMPSRSERLRVSADDDERIALEVVLHSGRPDIVEAFRSYAESLNIPIDIERRIDAGGACFVPVMAFGESLDQLSKFSFLRTVRAMPRLRDLTVGSIARSQLSAVQLPTEAPLDPDLRVAVFDGGIAQGSCLEPWVDSFEFADLDAEHPEFVNHGQGVTSALLFGSIDASKKLQRPFARVDHYRVLDANTGEADPFELYDVLGRIDQVLTTKTYEFASLSLGPDLPTEDDEIHSWTSVLDAALAEGDILAAIAVGNNGELDRASGIARIEPPADCVNGLAIGASHSAGQLWTRAPYSAVGPGRSPGIVKPDILSFGGSDAEPFVFVDDQGLADYTAGTSFSSPSGLRMGLGIRATFGSRVSPLAIKALLIHTAERHPSLDVDECGWGRVPADLSSITTCGDGEARVLYQGELSAAKYLRAQLPIPPGLPNGMVSISATLCFATAVDPQDPGNYTRSGLDVTFRPHANKIPATSKTGLAATKSFFGQSEYTPESELRQDAHKWETVLNSRKQMRASSLDHPVFDIHYNAREAGHAYQIAPNIRYAMVITVRMKNLPELYEEVLAGYTAELQALQPVVDLPVNLQL